MPHGTLAGVALAALMCSLSACAEPGEQTDDLTLISPAPFPLSYRPSRQWKLPAMLREVSGLATSPDGRLFAIEDEQAYVYELDYSTGALVKRFALGGPPLKGDFEGLAIHPDGDFYMVTSAGRLFKFSEGGANESVRYQAFDAGLRQDCEVEGLAYVASRGNLALACKRVYDGKKRYVRIHFWSHAEQQLTGDPLDVDIREARELMESKRFHASGIEWDASTDRFVLVSAREATVIEITGTGQLMWAARLKARYHRQAEGITYDMKRNLLISDEGGSKSARLAIYERFPAEAG